MTGQKKRFFFLIMIMVLLVTVVSLLSSYSMYVTSVNEQRSRLSDIVRLQKNVLAEIGVRLWARNGLKEVDIVNVLGRAHSLFMEGDSPVEFTVAKRVDDCVEFLIVDGQIVDVDSPVKRILYTDQLAVPMKKALSQQVGSVIGLDYKQREVLAAYNSLHIGDVVLGMVAKMDMVDIQYPFIRANFIVLGVGSLLTVLGVILFFRVSDPIIRDVKESEKKYRDLVESANSLILRINSEGNISFANQFASDYLQRDQTELLGLPFANLLKEPIDGEDVQSIAHFLRFRSGLNPTLMAVDNEEAGWVSWRARSFEGESPELLCIGTDVSNEYLAREAQKEIQERFRALAKAAPVGIIITEVEGNLIYANETMHSLTGASTVEMAGQGWLKYIEPEDAQRIKSTWIDGKRYDERYEFRLLDGGIDDRWVLGQAVALKNAQGRAVGSLVTLTDITRIKESELVQSRLTAAIEQVPEMIMISDSDGVIQYVNSAFVRTTGYSKDEIINNSSSLLKSGEHDTVFYKELWDTLLLGDVWFGRIVNKRKNGERYTQESTIGPIRNDDGEFIGYVSISRDVSDQLVIESRLRQSQKLESIGELAAGIAHEINTPTQYVASNLQFFEDAFKTYIGLSERCGNMLDFIAKSDISGDMDTLKELAENVMDREEIEYLNEDVPSALGESSAGLKRISEIVQSIKQLAHPGEMAKGYWSLNEIVTNAVMVSTSEWKYCAEIQYELDEGLPEVYCLKGEIGQVVLNLIVNAAHAIDAAGMDEGEQGVITVRTLAEDECVVLEISDTGSGIPDDIKERIFDPFFTTKEVGKGTGQGLAIAHNVVTNLHSGSLEVTSQLGEGSTFRIMLPFADKASDGVG